MSLDPVCNQGFRSVASAASKKSPLTMSCRTGDIMYGSGQGIGRQLSYPTANVNMNSVPNVAYDTYAPETVAAGEESVLGSTAMGVGLMAPIMARHTIMHPVKGLEAIKAANKTFAEIAKTGALKNMSQLEKAEIYKNLFKVNQFGPKVAQKGLQTTLTKANSAYVKALKAGDATMAAQKAGEMKAIIENGRKSILPFKKLKTVKQVKEMATAAGKTSAAASTATAAEAAAATARVAEATTASAKAMAYGKNAIAWTKSSLKVGGAPAMAVLECLVESPEVYTAFSDGGFGEGVKQTTKSAVKVGASVGGWCVGAKAGAALGASIGAVGGPVGAAIGSVVGLLAGGISGCMIAGKAAKAITGKSYTEKQQEQQEIAQNQMQYAQMMPQYEYNQGYTPKFKPILNPIYPNPFDVSDMYKL